MSHRGRKCSLVQTSCGDFFPQYCFVPFIHVDYMVPHFSEADVQLGCCLELKQTLWNLFFWCTTSEQQCMSCMCGAHFILLLDFILHILLFLGFYLQICDPLKGIIFGN